MKENEFAQELLNLGELFDMGVTIVVTNEKTIDVRGMSYHPDQEHYAIERSYEVEVEMDEDTGEVVALTNYDAVKAQIIKENSRDEAH